MRHRDEAPMFGASRLTLKHGRLIWAPKYRRLAAQNERSGSAPFYVNTGVNGYLYLPHSAPA
jgi:hypothetical protein